MKAAQRTLAALLAVASLACAAPALADDPKDEQAALVAEASRRFDSGIRFFKERDFAAALVDFKKAYELVPNYNVLYNLGQTARELKDHAAALGAFTRYLTEGGDRIAAARRAEVTSLVEDLRRRVGTLRVASDVEGATVTIDDVVVGKTPLAGTTVVNAGRRKVSATLAGYAPMQQIVEVASLEDATVNVTLVPLEAPRAPATAPAPAAPPPRATPAPAHPASGARRTPTAASWVALSGTVASAIGAGVLGGLAVAAHGDLQKAYATYPADEQAITDAQSRTRRFAAAADVLGAVAIAGAVATVVLFTVTPARTPAQASVAVGPTSVALRARF